MLKHAYIIDRPTLFYLVVTNERTKTDKRMYRTLCNILETVSITTVLPCAVNPSPHRHGTVAAAHLHM